MTPKYPLPKRLRQLANRMQKMADEMIHYEEFRWLAAYGKDLSISARIARQWAKDMEDESKRLADGIRQMNREAGV